MKAIVPAVPDYAGLADGVLEPGAYGRVDRPGSSGVPWDEVRV